MASNTETTRATDSTQFTIEELKRETNVTDQQLDTKIEQPDLPVLAGYLDNINEGYLEAMNLTPGQQTDVRKREYVEGTLAGMMLALTLWLNSQLRGTFRALIVILLSLGKILVAVQVFKYLSREDFNPRQSPQKKRTQSTNKDFPSPSGPSQERNPRLSSYRDYLQSLYQTLKLSSTTQWPPVSTNKVFKLAMIQKEKMQRGRIDDKFVRLTITGKIDDIYFQKKPVELKDIFSNTENDERKIVLIEGAPGSGKSTLAVHICQEWAKGKLFQEFDITILVTLRDPIIRDANLAIELLLPCRNPAMASEVGAEMLQTDGMGVLWVLDGWDELPSDLPQDSIINKLIRPRSLRESLLHKSTIIITSRPSSSAKLHQLVSSRVEVLGFTPQQLEQYFTECLNGHSQAVKTLLDRIRENPVVESSCYLPLNASIVVNCFLSDNHSLPTTNHEIFKSVVQSSLKRYLQDRLGKTISEVDITSPDTLPLEVYTPFTQMCQLAYIGIDKNKVTFTNKDLNKFSIAKDISNIGLLQSVPSILSNDQLVYYCFLHLSIQELLAAIHISLKSSKDQISVFRKLFGQSRFSAVFQFYTGITKLKSSRQFLSKLPQFMCPIPTAILDLVRKIVKKEYTVMYRYHPKPLLLSLMNCLYEAKDLSLYAFVADLFNHKLDLRYTTMNPIDCLSVGYFASFITEPFSFDLTNCSIGDQGCKFLVRGLSKCPHSHCKIELDFTRNFIHHEGIEYIAEILTNTTLLSQIDLSENTIGNSGLNTLCDALLTNTSLKTLNLSHCSLTLSDDNGAALYQLLSENIFLENLFLSDNTVISCHHIAAGLAVNKTLRVLNLTNCKLTDRNIVELSAGLINNIEELYIDINDDSLTENADGVKTLARHLTIHCPKLNRLEITFLLPSLTRLSFTETNNERKKNGLTTIDVKLLYEIFPQLKFY